MGKTLAAVVLWVAGVGGFAYYSQSGKAPVPSQPASSAPVKAQLFEPEPPTAPPPPTEGKPRTLEAFGFSQAGATKTLIVTPPAALGSPYTITLVQNGAIGPDAYVGINPTNAPSIYGPDASIGNPPYVPNVRNRLPVVWAYRWFDPHLMKRRPDGTLEDNGVRWRVFFTSGSGYSDYGGGVLKEVSQSPLSATPFTYLMGATPVSTVTAGWSLQLTD